MLLVNFDFEHTYINSLNANPAIIYNFIITKYLKQEVDDDISVCVDERSPCDLSITGDKYLSISCDKKGNDVTTLDGEVRYGLLSRSCFYCVTLITVAPLEI